MLGRYPLDVFLVDADTAGVRASAKPGGGVRFCYLVLCGSVLVLVGVALTQWTRGAELSKDVGADKIFGSAGVGGLSNL